MDGMDETSGTDRTDGMGGWMDRWMDRCPLPHKGLLKDNKTNIFKCHITRFRLPTGGRQTSRLFKSVNDGTEN